eukprot:4194806-Prymnesium_polylepis.1
MTRELWEKEFTQPQKHGQSVGWAADGAMYRGQPPPLMAPTGRASPSAEALAAMASNGAGVLSFCSAPTVRKWNLKVRTSEFNAPPPAEIVVLPGGKKMVGTPELAGGEAALASSG